MTNNMMFPSLGWLIPFIHVLEIMLYDFVYPVQTIENGLYLLNIDDTIFAGFNELVIDKKEEMWEYECFTYSPHANLCENIIDINFVEEVINNNVWLVDLLKLNSILYYRMSIFFNVTYIQSSADKTVRVYLYEPNLISLQFVTHYFTITYPFGSYLNNQMNIIYGEYKNKTINIYDEKKVIVHVTETVSKKYEKINLSILPVSEPRVSKFQIKNPDNQDTLSLEIYKVEN